MRGTLVRWILLGALVLITADPLLSQAPTAPPRLQVNVVVQSPADTKTDRQIFCLFRSAPENQLNGALLEMDDKLHGLLTQIRSAQLFGGELGETLLIAPPNGTLGAKHMLIIGLGDSASFTPERMYLVGKIAYREANRLGVVHPFFAPTILDGGVSKFATGDVAEQVVRGFLDAQAGEALVAAKSASVVSPVADFMFLAGAKHADDTRAGIARAVDASHAFRP